MKRVSDLTFQYITLATVWLWLSAFVLVPLALIALTSFMTHDVSHLARWPLTFDNYYHTLTGGYLPIVWRSLITAGITTVLCLLIALPFALTMAQSQQKNRTLMLIFIMIPFWLSTLIRTYAIMLIIQAHGLINMVLQSLNMIDQPLQLLYTPIAVQIGLIYNLLPFMILPLYVNLEKLDTTLIEAARDLRASRFHILRKIILPHCYPAIISGSLLVFLPAMTLFFIPEILGGPDSLMLGNLIQYKFLLFANWPQGAAISVILIAITLLLLIPYWRNQPKHNQGL